MVTTVVVGENVPAGRLTFGFAYTCANARMGSRSGITCTFSVAAGRTDRVDSWPP